MRNEQEGTLTVFRVFVFCILIIGAPVYNDKQNNDDDNEDRSSDTHCYSDNISL